VTRVWNVPHDGGAAADAYDFPSRLPRNAEELFVVLAFSGGGTRSAALGYGVLEKLRDTEVNIHGTRRRLLDEVDVITAVSGGSYPAAYFGLNGDRIFTDFESRFLHRNLQRALMWQLADPTQGLSLLGPAVNRADIAARFLDRHLFDGQTFSALSGGSRPFVIINASDLNNALTFSFIQPQFDFLCSNLNAYPVANAVMASSAVPGIFGAVALRNFDGCPTKEAPWVLEALDNDDVLERRYAVARALVRYRDVRRLPVVRLVDGGVTDNLGVRGSMMSPVAHHGNVPDMAGAFSAAQLARVRHVLVIVANAQVYREPGWSLSGTDPGLLSSAVASFNAALGILNTETAALARQGFLMWEQRINRMRAPSQAPVEVHFAVLTFNQIRDPDERARFDALPTSFHLDVADVASVRALAGRLLDESAQFQAFRAGVDRDLAP
jgi:NTE family protein